MGLALGLTLTYYTSVAKKLKLQVKKFWWLIPTFVEVTGEKLLGGGDPHPLQISHSDYEKKDTQNEHAIAHFEYFFT